MKKSNSDNSKIAYPHFLDSGPCGQDLFEGHSHDIIAVNICDSLKNDETCRVIGVDGGWGSGKSNLIKIVEDKLIKEDDTKFSFFIYDAWGLQNDSQRRSILEELTCFLTTKGLNNKSILDSNKWNLKLQELLSRKRQVESIQTPKFSAGFIIGSALIILIPILNVVTSDIPDICVRIWITIAPLLVLALYFLIILFVNWHKKGIRQFIEAFKDSAGEAVLVYTDKKQENILSETISEAEPSSRQFKNWMHDIDNDISSDEQLVIVIDNMDRLPKKKVQELWAAINTFFADESYKHIKVIVPFDRSHIINAFTEEDIEDTCFYGNDFINKTFNIVYRVSPPTMANWKSFFSSSWGKAFGEPIETSSPVIQVFDMLITNKTPRNIISFINEFVEIKKLFSSDIPDQYISLFIAGKDIITKHPDKEILNPSYLNSLDIIYHNDEDLPKYISALYYQLPPNQVIDVIYSDKIRKWLDEGNIDSFNSLKSLPEKVFWGMLNNAIVNVVNVPNAINVINECLPNVEDEGVIDLWKCLYRKVLKEPILLKIESYQKILLSKLTSKYKNYYLSNILNGLYQSESFNPTLFFDCINDLDSIEGVNPFDSLKVKNVKPNHFLDFVEKAGDSYKKYRIQCEFSDVDSYLAEKKMLEDVAGIYDSLKVLVKDCPFTLYYAKLKSICLQNNNKETLQTILPSLLLLKKPLHSNEFIPIVPLNNIFASCPNNDFIYYDLICMRLSQFSNFPLQGQPDRFATIINTTDVDLVHNISERIEHYASYGDLLHNLSSSPLCNAVAKDVTLNDYGDSNANLSSVLKEYQKIKDTLLLNPEEIISKFNKVVGETDIQTTDIPLIPLSFFVDNANDHSPLVARVFDVAKDYLQDISQDEWRNHILTNDDVMKLCLIVNIEIDQNLYNALCALLEEKAEDSAIKLSKDVVDSIIKMMEGSNGRIFKTQFSKIRDSFGRLKMTASLFTFFREWLFKYGALDEKADSIRTIIPNVVLMDSDNMNFILSQSEVLFKTIKVASIEDADEFYKEIDDLRNKKYQNDVKYENFAEKIGEIIKERQKKINGYYYYNSKD